MAFVLYFGNCSLASQYSDNSTEIHKEDHSSNKSCDVFIIETKLKGSVIGFAVIAAICIVAGLILVFAGIKLISINVY